MHLILEIARGIAALSVVFFHLRNIFEPSFPIIAQIARYGSLGVPLFFVISGYVIIASAEATIAKQRSAGSFLYRRFLRIFPPFWFSIVVILIFPYIIEAISFLKTGDYLWPKPNYLIFNWNDWFQIVTLTKIFMSSHGDLQAEFNPINSVYWTLAIEFQFYLCIYVALLFQRYFHLIVLSITALSGLLVFYPYAVINKGLFVFFWPMFAVGIALYYVVAKGLILQNFFPATNKIIAWVLMLNSTFMLIYWSCLGVLDDVLSDMFYSASFGFAVFSACILWFSMPLESSLITMKNCKNIIARSIVKFLSMLGVISYSIYLLHGKIVNLPSMIVRQIMPVDNHLYPFLILIGTITICAIFYRFFEKPYMSSEQKKIYSEN